MAHHYNPAHIGIRTEDYKLLFFYGASEKSDSPTTPPGWELYDLKNDPKEDINVYDDPKYKTIVEMLKTDLQSIRKNIILIVTNTLLTKLLKPIGTMTIPIMKMRF